MNSQIDLNNVSEEALLKKRLCDLPIQIEGTWLEECVNKLYQELKDKGIIFKPQCYLADEWLAPDQEPVVGIAFFLAHEALVKLERKFMLEAEGSNKDWCMKLLRHEAGHAINYAYQFYRRSKWKKIFGSFNKEYGDTYKFRPYSRAFVKHLEDYYAQYHPDEDFAETFAVWLTPGLDWQQQYRNWKALRKLKYVDELMNEIREKQPGIAKGKKYWQASKLKTTLKKYYEKKRSFSAEDFPDFHDANLRRVFPLSQDENSKALKISNVITKYQKDILTSVANWTGEKKYIVNQLIKNVKERAKELKLASEEPEPLIILKITTYITTLIMNYAHTGRFQGKKK